MSTWLTKLPPGTFSLLPHAVSRTAFLDSHEKNIWCYLSTHTKNFHPSEAVIAANLGISEKAVRNIIDRLIKKNAIEITNLPRRPGKKKKYRVVHPKHWVAEPVSKTGPLDLEQTFETWEARSPGPDKENQENSLVENQQSREVGTRKTVDASEVNLQFRETLAEILTRSKDIESITLHLSSLIKNYTSLNGKSPPEVNWLLKKARWWSDQLNLDLLSIETLEWNLINASSEGVAKYEEQQGNIDVFRDSGSR